MSDVTSYTKGLSNEQVKDSRLKHGANILSFKKSNVFLDALKSLVKEPMILLLLAAASIYFISGKAGDGIFLASAILLVATISLFQDARSRNALGKLKSFTQPRCKVIRNGKQEEILSEDLVIGDALIVDEGSFVAADAEIIHANDFSVNESILTGESFAVFKDQTKDDRFVYHGTNVTSGLAVATITGIGHNTKLGKIGDSLQNIQEEKTPLEIQIGSFVKKMVIVGAVVFLIVWAVNYFHSFDVLDSLLKALTLAMSILPEEIPVAFTSFMALGAWRLMKMGVIVKQMKTVETLGSATVICTDKTGTITENKMSLAKVFTLSSQGAVDSEGTLSTDEQHLIQMAMWSSEPIAFDPMEVALHAAYTKIAELDERANFHLVHEYPLAGKPPMMTHIFENDKGKRIVAAKGAPEALRKVCHLTAEEGERIDQTINLLAKDGSRVLSVAEASFEGNDFPESQESFKFNFKGIVAFYDPPKQNIQSVLENFYAAGIAVKIITGDNAATTTAIAKQIGFKGYDKSISGDDLMKMDADTLKKTVMEFQIFTRMFPDAKLKIIEALKSNQQIVAMTGDGVNDGPALKSAHIGIAMGKKGSEIAKQAASLILVDDDLSKMVDAIASGRKIYTNLKKAIQYIISIHIPIILIVFIPLVLNWIYPNILSPLHIIFLELIMGPTCSMVFENEPMEKNTMLEKPRPFTNVFFSWKELSTSLIQGCVITLGTLITYQYAVLSGFDESTTRAMVFTDLIFANLFLTLVNRSFLYSIFTTIRYKNNLVLIVTGITLIILMLLLYMPVFAEFFEFKHLHPFQFVFSAGLGFLSVVWYELVKLQKRMSSKKI